MQFGARFTPKGFDHEIQFTIVENEKNEILLYAIDNSSSSFKLLNDNGLLKLESENPFEEDIEIVNERLIGLSSDWLENRSQGFDNASDYSIQKTLPGYGPDDIFVENKPFSLRQIVDLIKGGDIELTPDFQRNFIWDQTRQSKLIESILLGLPLPSIYLSQYEDGRLTVVDGLQRLSTVSRFLDNELKLTNLEYLKQCNGKRFKELDGVLSPLTFRRFTQTQIMCFVIDYRSPSQLKFDLFRRLNTGGKPLNNQEIRNCLSRPNVQSILRGMVELGSFTLATGNSVKDNRMEAREAALRFIYFYEQYITHNSSGEYNGDMETTLDEFIDILNTRDFSELSRYLEIYDNALKCAYHLLGDYCFRKITPSKIGAKKTPVNKLLMLVFSILLSQYKHEEIIKKNAYMCLVESLANHIENTPNLFEAITYGTNGKSNIELALSEFKKLIETKVLL